MEEDKIKIDRSPPGGSGPLVGETKVQFPKDQNHVLVVHKSQIAVYDTNLR